MKKIIYFISILTIIIFSQKSYSSNLVNINNHLEKGPVLIINNDTDGAFDTVTTISIIHAPFQVVWNTILDINRYKDYMPQVIKSKILTNDEKSKVITAEFEIEVPLNNTSYTLKHHLDFEKQKIDIYQIEGDLEGSHWHWELKSMKEKTFVYYTGKTINFSSFLQMFEDKNKTISMGINVASALETIRLIKKRSELKP